MTPEGSTTSDKPRQVGGGRGSVGDLPRSSRSFHPGRAKENGVADEELVEAIPRLAFHAGWPKAMTAVAAARDVLGT